MKIAEAKDLCRSEANWTWSAVVVFSWLCFGAALYFMADQAGLFHFTYRPNEIGVISPATIARVPKIARTFHFIVGTGFSALMGLFGWWLWLWFCASLAGHSGREPRRIFSADAWANLILLVALADILYKFLPYAAAVVLGVAILLSCRVALFLYFRK